MIGSYEVIAETDKNKYSLNISTLKAEANNVLAATNYGGAVSEIKGTSYVSFDTFTLDKADGTRSGLFGGLSAKCENGYIYAKDVVIGNSAISGFTGGGLVGNLNNGVLGMTGTIDISKAAPTADDANGQLVGVRDNALIYAESWNYTPNSAKVDNVGSWGDVIVFGTLTKSNVFSEATSGNTKHMITFEATPSSIAGVADFAVFSLQFQIDSTKNSFITDYSAISNTSSSSISFTKDVDLSGTGLRGITRDNGSSKITYKGSVAGTSGKSITLDIRNERLIPVNAFS